MRRMAMSQGLRITLDREFQSICDELVQMGQMVADAIDRAMEALVESETDLAKKVIADDEQINNLRFKMEEDCMALIATQQPAASDLRAVIAVMHMVDEMERMGDHAAGIAKTVVMTSHEPLLKTMK